MGWGPWCRAQPVVPLPNAHSHNDYLRKHPLEDALALGFCSVEADIHLVDGQLLVAHDLERTKTENTLGRMYLEPLRERVRSNGGRVYANGPTFQLLIDIKSDGGPTYSALREVLKSYEDILTTFTPESTVEKAVTVIVSGDRPIDAMAAEPLRYAAVDGRLSDLDGPVNPNLMPLISDNWRNHFKWLGDGEFPQAERGRLRELVRAAHARGCRVRFWAIPHKEAFWKVMVEEGVNWINADDLARLHRFLSGREQDPADHGDAEGKRKEGKPSSRAGRND